MKLLVSTDAHIFRTPDKKFWCKSIYGYSFWQRYLEVFNEVRIVARVKDVNEVEETWLKVDGKGIEVYGIPFYQGPAELAKKYLKIKNNLKNVYEGCDIVLFRLPSPTGQLVYNEKKNTMPIGVEVVFDPTDSLKSSNNIFNYIINWKIISDLRKVCRTANGVSYVTSKTIQRNFPSYSRLHGEDEFHFETYYSTITLGPEAFGKPKRFVGKTSFTIAHSNVAMNSQRKGELTLLQAIKQLRNKGFDVNAVFIGDGSLRKKFEEKSIELGLSDHVKFTGLLASPEDVRQVLENSDLYVLPTQAEGLPRGIIEAMAVGLPCVSSPVGGIPELLEEQYLANPKDVIAIANIVIKFITSPKNMENASKSNIEKAKSFGADILQERRKKFYQRLKSLLNSTQFST